MAITTKEQAYRKAAAWGSYIHSDDPGAVMYSFRVDDGRPNDEAHRRALLAHLDAIDDGRPPMAVVDAASLWDLRHWLLTCDLRDGTPASASARIEAAIPPDPAVLPSSAWYARFESRNHDTATRLFAHEGLCLAWREQLSQANWGAPFSDALFDAADAAFEYGALEVEGEAPPPSDYLDRFHADHRATANRAYADGFEDGVNSADPEGGE